MLHDLRPDHEPPLPAGAYERAVRLGGRRRRLRRNRVATSAVLGLALTGMLLVGNPFEVQPGGNLIPADMPAATSDPAPSNPLGQVSPSSAAVPGEAAAAAKEAEDYYTEIVEPFRTPGRCDVNGSTDEVVACELNIVRAVDMDVDSLQWNRFNAATSDHERAALKADDRTWLARRQRLCATEADQMAVARCLVASSQLRRVELEKQAG